MRDAQEGEGLVEPKQFTLTRDVTRKECNWLRKDVKKGTVVTEYQGHTYGCISPYMGIGVVPPDPKDKREFVELPMDALATKETT